MRRRTNLACVLVLAVLCCCPAGVAGTTRKPPVSTVDRLLGLQVGPFAIGHRGSGANLGEDPSRPIENTVAAVREAFEAGLSVVEVDVQLTRDGQIAVFHDDFLSDLTCLNSLTLAELQARLPHVPTLQEVLQQARRFRRSSWRLSGLVIVELKPSAPLCDPGDTQEEAIVGAVVATIRSAGMTHQVMLTSLSPALLFRARDEAPEITRILELTVLQFLTPEQVERLSGLPVTLIDKPLSLGLQWGEIGPLFRLPGYRSLGEVLRTVEIIEARVIEADMLVLRLGGVSLVDLLRAMGLTVLGFTVNSGRQWQALQSLGVDGIYTDDVELGLRSQPPVLAW